MAIKRSPCEESAGGGWSTSKSTCVVPSWSLTSGNASFGDCGSRWSHQLISDPKKYLLFWKCLQWSCPKAVSVPSFVIGSLHSCRCMCVYVCVCHRCHYEGLIRCRLVGSCVLPGEISLHTVQSLPKVKWLLREWKNRFDMHALRNMLRTSGTDASTCRPPRTTRSSTNTAFHSRLFRSSTTSPVLPGGEWKRHCTSAQKRTRWTMTED